MNIKNNNSYNLSFKASFANDGTTNKYLRQAIDTTTQQVYALYKVLENADSQDTFSISYDDKYNMYEFTNQNTGKKVSYIHEYYDDFSKFFSHIINITKDNTSQLYKHLFGKNCIMHVSSDEAFSEYYANFRNEDNVYVNKKNIISDKIFELKKQKQEIEREITGLQLEIKKLEEENSNHKKEYVLSKVIK